MPRQIIQYKPEEFLDLLVERDVLPPLCGVNFIFGEVEGETKLRHIEIIDDTGSSLLLDMLRGADA